MCKNRIAFYTLILCPSACWIRLLVLTAYAHVCMCIFLRISEDHVICEYMQNGFTSFFPILMTIFSFLFASARASTIILNRNGESGLIPSLRGGSSVVPGWAFHRRLYQAEEVPLCS